MRSQAARATVAPFCPPAMITTLANMISHMSRSEPAAGISVMVKRLPAPLYDARRLFVAFFGRTASRDEQ